MAILGFGLNDTVFDTYAEEFGITLPEDDIKSSIASQVEFDSQTVQQCLYDDLFMDIIRRCLEELDIISTWEDIEPEWLESLGFGWESNGEASYLSFRGKRYFKKEEFYNDVKKALVK